MPHQQLTGTVVNYHPHSVDEVLRIATKMLVRVNGIQAEYGDIKWGDQYNISVYLFGFFKRGGLMRVAHVTKKWPSVPFVPESKLSFLGTPQKHNTNSFFYYLHRIRHSIPSMKM